MTDIFADVRARVVIALRGVIPDLPDDVAARVEVTPTRDPAHGDMATNAAMVAAKPTRQPPAKLAAALAEALRGQPDIAEAAPAGPGFDITMLEQPTAANPLGVKGSGQAGAMIAPQTVMHAVLDALAPLGVIALDMPATSERVWQAIISYRPV